MKEKSQITILLLIAAMLLSSCRLNRESLDVVIKNKSPDSYYFNINDVEHPSCSFIYKDDLQMLKEFYFSLNVDYGEAIRDMTMMPSSFSYELRPCNEITLSVKLKEGFGDYYKLEFDESKLTVSKNLLGQSKENHFFIFCSKEAFSYNAHYQDYCEKLKKYGIKLEGKQSGGRKIEFIID